MTFLEMPEDDKKDVKKITEALTAAFSLIHDFEARKLLPHESPHAFLFNLKNYLTSLYLMSWEMLKKNYSCTISLMACLAR